MNKGYKKLLVRFKKLLPKKKVGYVPRQVVRDWLNGIFVSVGVGFILCCIGVYQFYMTREVEVLSIHSSQEPLQTFNKERLDGVLYQYQERTVTFLDMRSTTPEAPDPGSGRGSFVSPPGDEVVSKDDVTEEDVKVSP